MCLALPAKVIELRPDALALIDLAGVTREISLALVDDVAVGDYVIVHVGFALSKIDPDEADRTLALMRDSGALADSLDELTSDDSRPGTEPAA